MMEWHIVPTNGHFSEEALAAMKARLTQWPFLVEWEGTYFLPGYETRKQKLESEIADNDRINNLDARMWITPEDVEIWTTFGRDENEWICDFIRWVLHSWPSDFQDFGTSVPPEAILPTEEDLAKKRELEEKNSRKLAESPAQDSDEEDSDDDYD